MYLCVCAEAIIKKLIKSAIKGFSLVFHFTMDFKPSTSLIWSDEGKLTGNLFSPLIGDLFGFHIQDKNGICEARRPPSTAA